MAEKRKQQLNNRVVKFTWKDVLGGVFLLLAVAFVLLMAYKTELKDEWDKKVKDTLKLRHKENTDFFMSADIPLLSETFVCKVPDLKLVRVECDIRELSKDTDMIVTLDDAETGENYFRKEGSVKKLVNSKKKIAIELDKSTRKKMGDTEDKKYILTLQLVNPENTLLCLSSNYKPGIVDNINGDETCKMNIIYDIRYSNCRELKKLYILFSVAILFFVAVSYILLIIKKIPIYRAYVSLALILGFIFNFVVMMHGVPDEPWHIDTAYKYSNKILMVEDTGNPGTIYKRECDIWMTDLLKNGMESNSYYMLLHHTFERPQDTELREVSFADTTNMVTGLVFIPTAIGISLGRVLGLSTILTISLGRYFNLITFVLLVALSIYIMPRGKQIMAVVGMLPIAMQQGASASYDPIICGVFFVFSALCFYMREAKEMKKWFIPVMALLLMFLATVKGGIYLPVSLLLIPLFIERTKKQPKLDVRKKIAVTVGVLAIAAVGGILLYLKFNTLIRTLMEPMPSVKITPLYSVGYIIKHPANFIAIIWATLTKRSDKYLREAIGGMLGWHDAIVSWVYVLILLIGLLMLVNVEGNQIRISKKWKLTIIVIFLCSAFMIALSQLLATTAIDAEFIGGIQGRYFLPILPLLLFATENSIVYVPESKANKIWMVMILSECMILLQYITLI